MNSSDIIESWIGNCLKIFGIYFQSQRTKLNIVYQFSIIFLIIANYFATFYFRTFEDDFTSITGISSIIEGMGFLAKC